MAEVAGNKDHRKRLLGEVAEALNDIEADLKCK